MIYQMVVLRTLEGIKECRLFTKHYEPITFDSSRQQTEMWLYLYHDLPDFWRLEQQVSATSPMLSSGKRSSCCKHVAFRPHRRFRDVVFLKDFILFFKSLDKAGSEVQLHDDVKDLNGMNTYATCSDAPKSDGVTGTLGASKNLCIGMIPEKVCTVFLNAHVANALLTYVVFSSEFRCCLLRNLRKKFQRPTSYHSDSCESDADMVVNYIIDIVSVWPVQRMDYAWGWYINHILTKRMLLEEAMALLSTLGGAHSSLGEYFLHHAEQAGEISQKQLRLALQLGDPLTVARCHMFWAFSLMQRGQWRKSRVIVRQMYKLASTHCVIDMRLINMCQAAWVRIQHLHSVDRCKKRLQHGTVKTRGAADAESTESHLTL